MSGRWDRQALERSLARVQHASDPLVPRKAAVALVLHLSDEPQVLLMKRAERNGDPWSGQVSLPGGRSEPRDEDLVRTALRETHEELGVVLDRERHWLGALAPLRARARGEILPLEVAPFVFAVGEKPLMRLCSAEVESAFWLPLDRAASGVLDRPFASRRGEEELQLPSWSFEGHTVWGMTHRILRSLIELVEAAAP